MLGYVSTADAITLTLLAESIISILLLLVAMAMGALFYQNLAAKVAMSRVPHMVALLSDFEGGSSVLIPLLALMEVLGDISIVKRKLLM